MDRLALHNELLKFIPNVYFQPPSTLQMKYPCIVYNKTSKYRQDANDGIYSSRQGYQVMVIEHNPDSTVVDDIERHFEHCSINQYYTINNLNHTTLNLYY